MEPKNTDGINVEELTEEAKKTNNLMKIDVENHIRTSDQQPLETPGTRANTMAKKLDVGIEEILPVPENKPLDK